MIDLASEKLLRLADAAALLPKRRAGKRPSASTLLRWQSIGLHGVRLETLRVGSTLCTSLEALQRFFDALTDLPSRRERPGAGGCLAGTATATVRGGDR